MKIIKTIAIAVLALGMFACGGKKEEGSTGGANTLDGTWKISKAEGTGADAFMGVSCKFEGSTMSLNEVPSPYKVSNDTITAATAIVDTKYTFKFEGSQLVITPIGTGQKWVMDKQ